MEYYLESHVPGYECIIETKEYCLTLDDAINYIDNIIDDFIMNSFYIEEETQIIEGNFDEYDLEEKIYSKALKYIHNVNSDLYVTSSVKSKDSPDTIRQTDISLSEYVHQRLEEIQEDSSFYGIVASAVEGRLLDYVDHSTWHVGLLNVQGRELEIQKGNTDIEYIKGCKWVFKGEVYYPVVWFGPSGYPSIPEWRISKETEEEEFEFWFCTQEWDIIKHLGENVSDVFLIWYTAECGCSAPEMEVIRNMCPVPIEDGDTVSRFLEKTNQYIIDNML